MNTENKKPFNKRSFVSIAMLVSFLFLPFSGIMNHNLQVSEFNKDRHVWMAIHNISALLFVIFSLFHIYFNRNSLVNHLKKVKITKEAMMAVLLVISITILFSTHALHVK